MKAYVAIGIHGVDSESVTVLGIYLTVELAKRICEHDYRARRYIGHGHFRKNNELEWLPVEETPDKALGAPPAKVVAQALGDYYIEEHEVKDDIQC